MNKLVEIIINGVLKGLVFLVWVVLGVTCATCFFIGLVGLYLLLHGMPNWALAGFLFGSILLGIIFYAYDNM